MKTLVFNGSPRKNGDTEQLIKVVTSDVGSRLQTYFCARFFRKEEVTIKPKKGAVVLVGGGDGNMEKAYDTACTLLRHMNCREIHELVCSHNTNACPAIKDEKTLVGVDEIVEFFNK